MYPVTVLLTVLGTALEAARRYGHRRLQFYAKIAADLRPSTDGSAVRTSLVAGGG